ncbi:MAG: GTPase ObgE [Calditerrivibrio sp.]|nr:GTPase ObgE [Calditerrivibrio sp.]MCA1980644.1 GTPase ObgE [Calditerrivibrio sp.]
MKFIDIVKIIVKAGDGGDGCVSFRREKYVPKGGPDGGHGGKGGDIVLVGDSSKHTLLDLNYKHIYKAERGAHGRGNDQNGKWGEDLFIKVPLGTIVKNADNDEIIGEIIKNGETLVVAKGGRGGRGNLAFVSSTQRAPRIAEPGEAGEEFTLILELKLIADVGIVGFPNAGKSTFISVVSAAKPKIADYPFTTLAPNLGVVKGEFGKSFVLADMPGLIEGAHEGQGLGIQFLKHIERTKFILHFVDASSESSMIENYRKIRRELEMFSPLLAEKYEIIVATKIDSANLDNLKSFREFSRGRDLFEISSLTRDGVDNLISFISEQLDTFVE